VVVRAQLVETDCGLVPKGEGWFVLNAREAEWWELRTGGGALCDFEGAWPDAATDFRQLAAYGSRISRIPPSVDAGSSAQRAS
jgi:hypothetical protein